MYIPTKLIGNKSAGSITDQVETERRNRCAASEVTELCVVAVVAGRELSRMPVAVRMVPRIRIESELVHIAGRTDTADIL